MTRKTCYCQEYRSSLVFIWNEAGVLKAHFLIDIQLKNAGAKMQNPSQDKGYVMSKAKSMDALTTILTNQEVQQKKIQFQIEKFTECYSSVVFFGSRKGTTCTRVGQPNLLDATLKPCFARSRLLAFTRASNMT